MLSFSNLDYKNFWLADKFKDKIKYSCKIYNNSSTNKQDMFNLIDFEIKEICAKF